ncbi:MAG: serine/threonine-protein kinase PknK [Bradymonadaceae bacterium]
MSFEVTSDDDISDAVTEDASSDRSESSEDGEPFVGRLLKDRYEIVECIGEGGMGRVYAARQQPLGREVAVKLVQNEGDDDSDDYYFMREIEAINRLRHPNIVNFIDYGTDDDLLYLVMEYLPGQTLREVIGHQYPIAQLRIAEIGVQVLSALEQAHKQGVVLCDLKPANIMLEEVTGQSDFVKLLDFGVAKVGGPAAEPGPHTREGDIVGTFDYMSPEQILRKDLDGRADVWSLGVILFEMLTQTRIFRAEDAVATVGRVVRADIPSPSDFVEGIDAKLEAVIAEALTRRVEDRPNAAELRDMLVQVRDRLKAKSGVPGLLRQREGDEAGGHGLIEQSDAAESGFPEVTRGGDHDWVGVTRDRARAVLETQLAKVGEGQGSGLLVTGPSGSGKSHFLDWTLERLATEGWQVFRANSDGGGSQPALGFARTWIRELLPRALREDQSFAEVLDSLGLESTGEPVQAFLTGRSTDLERVDRIWPGDEEFATFVGRLLQELVRAALRFGPASLAVDDFPSGSRQAQRVIEVLSAGVSEYPVFVLASGEPGWETSSSLGEVAEDIRLELFNSDEIERFLVERFGIRFSSEIVEKIRAETGGNPREIEELLGDLEGKNVSQPTTSAKISARLSLDRGERITSQLERMDAQRVEWLKRLSVWGGTVPVAVVDRLREQEYLPSPSAEPTRLEGPLTERAFDVFGRECVRFLSERVREALYNSVPERERCTWHRLAADIAEERDLCAELLTFERLELVGRHLLRAGDTAAGGRAFWKAGERRRQRFDRLGAIAVWSRALEGLRSSGMGGDVADVAGYNAASLIPALRREDRTSAAVDAAYEFVGLGGVSSRLRAIATAELGRSLVADGDDDEAARRLRRLWGQVSEQDDPVLQIRTLLGLSEVYRAVGKTDRRSTLLREAVRCAGRATGSELGPVDRAEMLWQPHNRLGLQRLDDEQPDKALRLFRAGREIAERLGDVGGLVRLTSNLGAALLWNRDVAEAGEWFERALELTVRHGDFLKWIQIRNNLGVALLEHGDRAAGRQRFEEARERADQLGWSEGLGEVEARLERLNDDDDN